MYHSTPPCTIAGAICGLDCKRVSAAYSPKRPLVSRHTTSAMAPLIANSPDWNMRSEMNVTSMCQARFLLLKKSNWHGERHADPLTGPTQVGGRKVSQLANKEIGTCLIGRCVIASPEHTGNTYTVSRFAQAAFTPSLALRAQAGALAAVW